MTDTVTKPTDRFAALVGEPVIVTFADDHEEAGMLAALGWDTLAVEHIEGSDHWTAAYTLTGDEDTPHVVSVAVDRPQKEALFQGDPLF
jgi:hypothetical protein